MAGLVGGRPMSPGPSSAKRVKFADNNDKGARTKATSDEMDAKVADVA